MGFKLQADYVMLKRLAGMAFWDISMDDVLGVCDANGHKFPLITTAKYAMENYGKTTLSTSSVTPSPAAPGKTFYKQIVRCLSIFEVKALSIIYPFLIFLSPILLLVEVAAAAVVVVVVVVEVVVVVVAVVVVLLVVTVTLL